VAETILKRACFYFTNQEVERLDRVWGMIPRSRLGVLAINRLLDDIESGKLDLLPLELNEKETQKRNDK
jgi:hypothetical protein